MARSPKLGKKNGYYYTRAGDPNGVYFGRVGVISYQEARQKFAEHLKAIGATARGGSDLTAAVLFDQFLDAVQTRRSDRTYDERQRHLDRFANFRRGSTRIGDLPARAVTAADLAAFLKNLEASGLDPWTVHKYAISVGAAFNWGAGIGKLKNPSPCLPASCRPFAQMEKYRRPPEPLEEGELPTADEVARLLAHADDDLELVRDDGRRWRTRRPEEFRTGEANPYRGFGDLLRVYVDTGARTSELAAARVRNLNHNGRAIVLGREKRTSSMKLAAPRRIMLNSDDAFTIVERACDGRAADDAIFFDPRGRPWNRDRLARRFAQVRERAGVRPEITIYSFRHLWISDMVMAGVDVATVAKMAGTSIAMIERVYAHFKADHFAEAQKRLSERRGAAAVASVA